MVKLIKNNLRIIRPATTSDVTESDVGLNKRARGAGASVKRGQSSGSISGIVIKTLPLQLTASPSKAPLFQLSKTLKMYISVIISSMFSL